MPTSPSFRPHAVQRKQRRWRHGMFMFFQVTVLLFICLFKTIFPVLGISRHSSSIFQTFTPRPSMDSLICARMNLKQYVSSLLRTGMQPERMDTLTACFGTLIQTNRSGNRQLSSFPHSARMDHNTPSKSQTYCASCFNSVRN